MSSKCYVNDDIFYINYETLRDIPLSDYEKLHREYWKANAESHKYKLPIASAITGDSLYPMSGCFACEYASRMPQKYRSYATQMCQFCPIKECRKAAVAGVSLPCCASVGKVGHVYLEYCVTNAPEYALKIANLEWEDT